MRAAVCTALFLSALVATGCSYKRIAVRSVPAPPGFGHDEEREGTSTGALEWFLSRRAGEGATDLPAERYAAAREHVARMPRYSVSTEPASDFLTWPELIADPNDGQRLFLRGGNILWRSLDQGTNWTAVGTVGERRPGERDRSLSVRFDYS